MTWVLIFHWKHRSTSFSDFHDCKKKNNFPSDWHGWYNSLVRAWYYCWIKLNTFEHLFSHGCLLMTTVVLGIHGLHSVNCKIRWIVMHLLLTGECLQVYTRHNAYQVCTTSEYSHFTRIHASYRRILHLPCGSMVYKKRWLTKTKSALSNPSEI